MNAQSARNIFIALACIVGFTSACGPKTQPPTETPEPTPPAGEDAPPPFGDQEPAADRPTSTIEECEAQGGTIVGDPGDGSVHREDYRCESGEAPISRIESGVEGSVCCPAAEDAGW